MSRNKGKLELIKVRQSLDWSRARNMLKSDFLSQRRKRRNNLITHLPITAASLSSFPKAGPRENTGCTCLILLWCDPLPMSWPVSPLLHWSYAHWLCIINISKISVFVAWLLTYKYTRLCSSAGAYKIAFAHLPLDFHVDQLTTQPPPWFLTPARSALWPWHLTI